MHQLAVHTVGGVVSAGEALMLIVPKADRLEVTAQVVLPGDEPIEIWFQMLCGRTTLD